MRSIALLVLLAASQVDAREGACGKRELPSNRIRHLRNVALVCSSGVDHFIRTPQTFDFDEWRQEEIFGDRKAMQALGRKLPPIKWQGAIPYATVEQWTWDEWVYGTDSSCPPKVVSHTRTVTKNGKTETETYTTTEMGECWHDETRNESRHCSSETMKVQGEFVRPTLEQWNPSIPEYYDVLPNKYDLLPGEYEDVQVYNSKRQANSMVPHAEVGDAWNDYRFDIQVDGRSGAVPCQPFQKHVLTIKVHTDKRKEKRGPNPFRPPLDQFGNETDMLRWFESMTNDGKEWVKSSPRELRLTDASETMIESLSRQSRTFDNEIEQEKTTDNEGYSIDSKELRENDKKSGFWKQTMVRIRLYKHEPTAIRDVRASANLYIPGGDVSEDGQYVIPLVSSDKDRNLYKVSGPLIPEVWSNFRLGLEPGRKFQMLVSMYNKGVPFYAQDCNDEKNKNHWSCRLGWRSEDQWYSKELPVDFQTHKKYDDRSPIQKLSDFQGKPLWRKLSDIAKSIF